MKTRIARAIATAAAAALLVAGCGDDGGDSGVAEDAGSPAGGGGEGGGESTGGELTGGSGTLVVDGEAVELTTVRCFLESQPAAAGGGNILFVVQGEGVDADGEAVLIDVSRFDEGSQFAGDDVEVYVGDVVSGEATELSAGGPAGTVTLDGSNASAEDLPAEDLAALTQHTVSFDIDC